MKVNNPFGYLWTNSNETVNTLDDRIFTKNKGLALLVLTKVVVTFALWDTYLLKRTRKYLSFKFSKDSILERYGSWLVGKIKIRIFSIGIS